MIGNRQQFVPPPVGSQVNSGHPLAPNAGLWLFNEGGGIQGIDSSGLNHATIQSPTMWSPSPLGGGLLLDGSTNYATAPSLIDWTAGTMVVWLIPSATLGANAGFFTQNASETGFNNGISYFHSLTSVRLRLRSAGADNYAVAASLTPVGGTMYQFIATWGPRGMEIYVNGILAGTGAFTGAFNASNQPPNLGAFQHTARIQFFPGRIMYASLYRDRQLRPEQALSLYTNPFQMFTPPVRERFSLTAAVAATGHYYRTLLRQGWA